MFIGLFVGLAVMCQPALWIPSLIAGGDRLATIPAAVELRPINPQLVSSGALIEINADWTQAGAALDSQDQEVDQVVLVSGLAPNTRVFVNGIMLDPDPAARHGRMIRPLPRHYLHDGRNRLDVIYQASERRSPAFVVVTPRRAMAGTEFYLEMMAHARWLTALMGVVLAAGLGSVTAIGGSPSRAWQGGVILLTAFVAVPDTMAGALGWQFGTSAPVLAAAGAGLCVLAAGILSHRLRLTRFNIMLAGLLGLAGARSLCVLLLEPLSPWPAVIDGPVVALALTLLLGPLAGAIIAASSAAARTIGRLRHRESLIREQGSLIAQQAQSLEEEIRKRAVLEERARFARDMHDGLGGNLLSLLVEVRTGEVSRDRIEAALEANLDDMRLMIDSLDTAEKSFALALGTFRNRVGSMLEACDIDVSWNLPDASRIPALPPQQSLNLLRMLQEAATNIVRHSGGNAASFDISVDDDRGLMHIEISDNGPNADRPAAGADRPTSGLKTMESRINALDGRFSAGPKSGGGWTIQAEIPI